jgi:endoglucanase
VTSMFWRVKRSLLLVALATLALPAGAVADGALGDGRFFVDPDDNLAGTVIGQIRRSKPDAARALQVIADQPEAKRFGTWTSDPRGDVAQYLARAAREDARAIPLVSTYRLQHKTCGGAIDGADEVARYKDWYARFAQGIGGHRVVVLLEIDALMTAGCLSNRGRDVRVDELRSAIGSLAAAPNAIVYLDGAAADVGNPPLFARLLRRMGVGRIEGVFTNGTHQNWTSREIAYGERLAQLVPGLRYVVNTATNGRGPLIPRDRVRHGNTVHCNPPGRGLGPKPTTDVPARHEHLDAFVWAGQPGRSAGECSATPNPPPSGTFWVDYALTLVRNADFCIR